MKPSLSALVRLSLSFVCSQMVWAGSPFPDARPDRLQLQPNLTTTSEVKKRLGSPAQKIELHRSLLPLTVATVCGAWDQRSFNTWIYEDTVQTAEGVTLNQETRIFFNEDDKMCASAVWYAAPKSNSIEQVNVDRLPEPERIFYDGSAELPMCTIAQTPQP